MQLVRAIRQRQGWIAPVGIFARLMERLGDSTIDFIKDPNVREVVDA